MKHFKFFILAILMVLPCVFSEAQSTQVAAAQASPVVEVLYFHGSQRCRTCVALEEAAKETIASKFASQVEAGKVIFREIDLSTKEGEKIGDKYEIAWSSLLIIRKEGKKEKVYDMTEDGFRYAVNNKTKIQYLIQQKISEFLK